MQLNRIYSAIDKYVVLQSGKAIDSMFRVYLYKQQNNISRAHCGFGGKGGGKTNGTKIKKIDPQKERTFCQEKCTQ